MHGAGEFDYDLAIIGSGAGALIPGPADDHVNLGPAWGVTNPDMIGFAT